MRQRAFAALAGVLVLAFDACEHAPVAALGPTMLSAASSSTAQLEAAAVATWGVGRFRSLEAENKEVGFTCLLGPFGVAEQSHVVVSASGNVSLVCSGKVDAPPPESAIEFEAFPCVLPSGEITTDSRAVFTPSGHVTLTCQLK